MRVVHLCRHAKAAPGDPDEQRALTRKGVDQAHALGKRLSAAPDPPAVVLTSPPRARQTAEIVAEETGAELRSSRCSPPARPSASCGEPAGFAGPVAAVGHQPDCSEIAIALTGRDPGFPPGGDPRLELSSGVRRSSRPANHAAFHSISSTP